MKERYQELNDYFYDKMMSLMPIDPDKHNGKTVLVKINDRWELELNVNMNNTGGGVSLDLQPIDFWAVENISIKDKYHRLLINHERLWKAELYQGSCWNVCNKRKLESVPENWFHIVSHTIGLNSLRIAFDSLLIGVI